MFGFQQHLIERKCIVRYKLIGATWLTFEFQLNIYFYYYYTTTSQTFLLMELIFSRGPLLKIIPNTDTVWDCLSAMILRRGVVR